MPGSGRKNVKQYVLGCAALVLILIAFLVATAGAVHLGYRKAFRIREELERTHANQAEFTPPATGAIPQERLQRFLAVREALFPLCDTVSVHQQLFERVQQGGRTGQPQAGSPVRDSLRMLTSMFRVGRDYGEYGTARNQALLEQEMGLGEYTWTYFVVYHSWFGHRPALALGGGSRKNVYRDRILPQVREMIRRHVEEAGERQAAAAWRSELEMLERSPGRIPFEDGLPPELEDSLEPFRDELERLACPPASELEVVRTVKAGIGYDHR